LTQIDDDSARGAYIELLKRDAAGMRAAGQRGSGAAEPAWREVARRRNFIG